MSISYFTLVVPSVAIEVWREFAVYQMALTARWLVILLFTFFFSWSTVTFQFTSFQQSHFMPPTLLRQWALAWCSGVICSGVCDSCFLFCYFWVWGCYMAYEMRERASEFGHLSKRIQYDCFEICLHINIYFIGIVSGIELLVLLQHCQVDSTWA